MNVQETASGSSSLTVWAQATAHADPDEVESKYMTWKTVPHCGYQPTADPRDCCSIVVQALDLSTFLQHCSHFDAKEHETKPGSPGLE